MLEFQDVEKNLALPILPSITCGQLMQYPPMLFGDVSENIELLNSSSFKYVTVSGRHNAFRVKGKRKSHKRPSTKIYDTRCAMDAFPIDRIEAF
jgi:hypothetical protein